MNIYLHTRILYFNKYRHYQYFPSPRCDLKLLQYVIFHNPAVFSPTYVYPFSLFLSISLSFYFNHQQSLLPSPKMLLIHHPKTTLVYPDFIIGTFFWSKKGLLLYYIILYYIILPHLTSFSFVMIVYYFLHYHLYHHHHLPFWHEI